MRSLLLSLALVFAGCVPGESFVEEPPATDADAGEGDAGSDGDAGTETTFPGRTLVGFACTPAAVTIHAGASARVRVTATFDDGQSADVSGRVAWSSTSSSVAQVEVLNAESNLVRVIGGIAGLAQVRARSGSVFSTACTVTVAAAEPLDSGVVVVDGGQDAGPPMLEEARALWVTRFAYNSETHVRDIMNRASDAGFNTIYFQIRGNGDAYYDSKLVPWAKKLSGTLGKDPGWDPLRVALDSAHGHGMALHAYFNVFTAWPCSGAACTCRPEQGHADSCALPEASPDGGPQHILRAHPEWLAVQADGGTADSEYFWFSPGNPAVAEHLVAVADELLTKYEVDGLHLDRVRYSGQAYSHDAVSKARYEALPTPRPAYASWQRQNVTDAVDALYQKMKQRRPNAALSAAVWGIYKPLAGCNTSQGYGNYYQDSLGWVQAGVIDAIVPMIYWDLDTGCTDWARLLDSFMAGASGRHVIAGMHALDNMTPQIAKMTARTEYGRSVGAAGMAVFASTYLEPSFSGTNIYPQFHGMSGPFQAPAIYPSMPWR